MRKITKTRFDRLDHSLESLLKLLSSQSDDVLNLKPASNQWSVLQVMHHVLRSEQLALAYLKKKLSFQPKLPTESYRKPWRRFVVWTTAYIPIKLKAPKVVSTETLPEKSALADISAAWRKQRADMRELLTSLPDDMRNKVVFRHPFANLLTIDEMLYFHQAHFNRHLGQINRIFKTLGSRSQRSEV